MDEGRRHRPAGPPVSSYRHHESPAHRRPRRTQGPVLARPVQGSAGSARTARHQILRVGLAVKRISARPRYELLCLAACVAGVELIGISDRILIEAGSLLPAELRSVDANSSGHHASAGCEPAKARHLRREAGRRRRAAADRHGRAGTATQGQNL